MNLLKPAFVNGTFLHIPNMHLPDCCQWEKFGHPEIAQKSPRLSRKTDFKFTKQWVLKIHFRQKSNYLYDTVHISSNTHLFYYAVKSYILKNQCTVHVKSKQTDLSKSQYPRVMLIHQINRMKYQSIKASFYQRKKSAFLKPKSWEATYSEMLKKSFHYQYTEETGKALSLNFRF